LLRAIFAIVHSPGWM